MELKITGNQEKLTLQNNTHVLESVTRKTFLTDRLSALKEFITDYGQEDEERPYSVYFDEQVISVWPVFASGDLDRDDCKIAQCNLKYSDELKILIGHINEDIKEKDFCNFLRKMAKFGDMLKLKDSIENMQMKKIVSMSKSKDSRGNFSYEYSMKDEGKATFDPPARLKFTIPVYKHIEKSIVFEPEFVFTYSMVGTDETKEARLTYRLEMLNLDQFIEQACTALIEDQMKEFTCKKYWGGLEKKDFTDEWKYMDVPMKFEGLPVEQTFNGGKGY